MSKNIFDIFVYVMNTPSHIFKRKNGYFIAYKSSTTLDPPRPLPGDAITYYDFIKTQHAMKAVLCTLAIVGTHESIVEICTTKI
jgi:hypothetical protein